ncbi:MAG TPA: UvrD-helicase domain-containing protein [Candidatus Hydrogenedentes bacterium]|nr:UvrD-helicase domain-containing protein [Candidatus Hydrogenedentota bacterium]
MLSLNEQQQAAVTAEGGPVLVLAGAGSGKTRVIIERLVWLVQERGVDPRHLLAMTFTNKAALEMKDRFAARVGADRAGAWLGTFHAFGLVALRRDMDRLGRPKNFTVFDDSDQLSLMKKLVKDLPDRFEAVSPREALTWISRLKQKAAEPVWDKDPFDSLEESCREVWVRYHAALLRAAAVDFDDLLSLVVKLLHKHADIRERYQQRYQHVLIDEYQDTNHAQYLIAHHLSEAHGNIFAVGDEDQSIYSWRGADINNILDFARDFPNARIIRLEQNYRSTKPILDAANALVANNFNRLGKNLFTTQKIGDTVRFFLASDGVAEAQFVVGDVTSKELSPKQVAVLFRTNAQSRLMEEALRRKGLHYVVVGGIKFYSRKEIKDLLAYLRLLVNPNDDESLRRVINVPPRGIGGTSLERMEEYAELRKMPLLNVMREVETDTTLPSRARESAAKFVHLIDDLTLKSRDSKLLPVMEHLLEAIGYRDYVLASDEKDSRSRMEIVDEFLATCKQQDERGSGGLLEFLQDLALVSDVDEWDSDMPAVTLMTCHSAKGLEFDYVYLIGLEEGLLPYGSEFHDNTDLEEERRLCYVAMTRARKGLTLCAARSRVLYGKPRNDRTVSRFIGEIGLDRLAPVMPGQTRQTVAFPEERPRAESARLRTGSRVRHATFGLGTVQYTNGSGDKLKARIRFDTGKVAMLLVKAAPLELLEGKHR